MFRKLTQYFIVSLFNLIALTGAQANVLQINLDHFDRETMDQILRHHGSFEIIGPSVDALSETAQEALQECQTILNLPVDILNEVYNQGFNGFQNVQKESYERFLQGKGPVRNQVAFHFKPYKERKVPRGMELTAYPRYYEQALHLLNRLYDRISESYAIGDRKTVFRDNAQTSVLTSRKYFPSELGQTGIPGHSDYGLLTLVVSNQDGLEVLEGENTRNGKWLRAPWGEPGKLRFYINVGDWLLFQIGNRDFVAGVHQVPTVEQDRYSLAVFLNPPLDQELTTFTGVNVDYGKFLMSDKKAYHINPRLDN